MMRRASRATTTLPKSEKVRMVNMAGPLFLSEKNSDTYDRVGGMAPPALKAEGRGRRREGKEEEK